MKRFTGGIFHIYHGFPYMGILNLMIFRGLPFSLKGHNSYLNHWVKNSSCDIVYCTCLITKMKSKQIKVKQVSHKTGKTNENPNMEILPIYENLRVLTTQKLYNVIVQPFCQLV